ncbi:MAG: hypothetical protein P4L77_12105 [Sulfuriferula sp.]|nr:hypothetical protein [Sulfuriferula sp.]
MGTTTKVYALLSATGGKIQNCTALLPNRLQCWRAGDYLVTETIIQPAVAATETKAALEEKVVRNEYQLCRFHTLQVQERDALAEQQALAAVPATEDGVKAETIVPDPPAPQPPATPGAGTQKKAA